MSAVSPYIWLQKTNTLETEKLPGNFCCISLSDPVDVGQPRTEHSKKMWGVCGIRRPGLCCGSPAAKTPRKPMNTQALQSDRSEVRQDRRPFDEKPIFPEPPLTMHRKGSHQVEPRPSKVQWKYLSTCWRREMKPITHSFEAKHCQPLGEEVPREGCLLHS